MLLPAAVTLVAILFGHGSHGVRDASWLLERHGDSLLLDCAHAPTPVPGWVQRHPSVAPYLRLSVPQGLSLGVGDSVFRPPAGAESDSASRGIQEVGFYHPYHIDGVPVWPGRHGSNTPPIAGECTFETSSFRGHLIVYNGTTDRMQPQGILDLIPKDTAQLIVSARASGRDAVTALISLAYSVHRLSNRRMKLSKRGQVGLIF